MDKNSILRYLKKKKKMFKNKFDIKNIGLFGSFVRNEQTPDSDIDIVYEMSEGNNLGYFQFIELENILKKSFKKDIELINYKYLNPIIKYKADKEIIYV